VMPRLLAGAHQPVNASWGPLSTTTTTIAAS
jgi:hypothetical protein